MDRVRVGQVGPLDQAEVRQLEQDVLLLREVEDRGRGAARWPLNAVASVATDVPYGTGTKPKM